MVIQLPYLDIFIIHRGLPAKPDSPEATLQSPIQTPPVPHDEDEREPMLIQPYHPNYVPEPMYPEYIPLEDEHVLSAEEQPLPHVVSPTAESLEYVTESDPEEEPEEYEDDETEDGPVDYPMDGGDDGDDDNGESSRDDADDEDENEEDEEDHFVPADSAIVIPIDELAAISLPREAEVERLLAMPTPPPSPLALLSPSSAGERMARCTTPSACPSTQTLRLASAQALIDAITAVIPSPPLPPPLYIPPPFDRRDDIPEIKMPPRKRLCLSTLGSRYEIGESSTTRPIVDRGIDYGFVNTLDAKARRRGIGEVRYGIRDTWVDPTETVYEIAPMTIGETKIAKLRETDHRHQAQMVETLRVMGDMRRDISDIQAELLALREQPRRSRQPEEDARVPDHQDAPRDADSHI
nr:hypothetical protein [Tanacetum cinerariifolium]